LVPQYVRPYLWHWLHAMLGLDGSYIAQEIVPFAVGTFADSEVAPIGSLNLRRLDREDQDTTALSRKTVQKLLRVGGENA
jgi:acyl-[acyl carrier protein]--UDP-N-acetylglucosamine O-acyltransferase